MVSAIFFTFAWQPEQESWFSILLMVRIWTNNFVVLLDPDASACEVKKPPLSVLCFVLVWFWPVGQFIRQCDAQPKQDTRASSIPVKDFLQSAGKPTLSAECNIANACKENLK